MRIVCVIASCLLLAAAAGCGSAGDDGRIDVVAAFYPLAFAAERIGGDRVSVTNLTPPGAEPHDVELTPQDVAEVQRADVVLYLSHGFQPALERALEGARGERVDVLDGLPLRAPGDAHVWLDPTLFAHVVARVGKALDESAAARSLEADLRRLDGEFQSGLRSCRVRRLVTAHAAFGYLAERYHLRPMSITGLEPGAEPGAKTLLELTERIRRHRVSTVFAEKLLSPELAETLAREAGVTVAVLDPIEGLTEEEADRGEDYFSLMRRNLATLRKALGCR
jgi:zinc transport system substrate-binding protein